MLRNTHIKALVAMSLTVILAACGGGGGSAAGTPAATNVSAAGVWQGVASPSGNTVDLIVLPNNQFYTVFGTNLGGGLNVLGFDSGSVAINGSQLAGSFTEYTSLSSLTGNLTGTIVTNTSITGTRSYSNSSTGSFALTPISNFTYNKAAKVTDISGGWTGTLLGGTLATLTIDALGNLSGTSNGGCSYTGTVTPNNSGVNAFDVSVNFGAPPCAAPNQTFTGIAIDYPTTSATTQLVAIVKNAANSLGTAFFAQR